MNANILSFEEFSFNTSASDRQRESIVLAVEKKDLKNSEKLAKKKYRIQVALFRDWSFILYYTFYYTFFFLCRENVTQLYRAVCISFWNLTSLKHVQYLDLRTTEKFCVPVKWVKKSLQPNINLILTWSCLTRKRGGRMGCRQGDDKNRILKEVQLT